MISTLFEDRQDLGADKGLPNARISCSVVPLCGTFTVEGQDRNIRRERLPD